jgi:hypothetical protein
MWAGTGPERMNMSGSRAFEQAVRQGRRIARMPSSKSTKKVAVVSPDEIFEVDHDNTIVGVHQKRFGFWCKKRAFPRKFHRGNARIIQVKHGAQSLPLS